MQWDLLRTFEAVARLGSLTAAARALGSSQSTVSRHLARLEELAGSPLLLRETPVRLTARGAGLLEAMHPMLGAALAARAALEQSPELRGRVTITTVGELIRGVLVHQLPALYTAHPRLELALLADNRNNSLAAGEADIALRFGRPREGDLITRRLRVERFGLYAAPDLPLDGATPWLGLGGTLSGIPEQRYATAAFADRAPRLEVEDVEALRAAVVAGLGVAVLPRSIAAGQAVIEIAPEAVGARLTEPVADRAIWMVVHRARHRIPKVRAVMDWLAQVLRPEAVGDEG